MNVELLPFKLDYLKIVFRVEEETVVEARWTGKVFRTKETKFLLMKEAIFDYFNLGEDKIVSSWGGKKIYEHNSVSLVIEFSRTTLELKGGAFLKEDRNFWRVLQLVRRMDELSVEWYVSRVDIAREYWKLKDEE